MGQHRSRTSLPQGLLAILSALISHTAGATISHTSSISSTGHFGDYIASGMGVTTSPSSIPTTTQPMTSNNSSLAGTGPRTITSTVYVHPLNSTGSGSDYATSCEYALLSWAFSSMTYGSMHPVNTTYVSTTTYPSGYESSISTDLRTVSASSVTTLCDGHPRAIGSARYVVFNTTTFPTTYTITTTAPGPFTTPPPCTINPTDCAALYSTFRSVTSKDLLTSNETVLEPPCATSGTSYSIKEDTCFMYGPNQVYAQAAQLFYWPVRTINGTDNFCHPAESSWIEYTPTTVPGTRTGDGPNTFVTGSLTITSPTVAISLSSLMRGDGCGPTIDHTILTVPPEQVNSVRGARAAFEVFPFNYADLNWMCAGGPNGTFTLQDTQGENCYQNVPAQAYWGAYPSYDQFQDYTPPVAKTLTMVNDYHPYIQPPSQLSEFLTSLWGTSAIWHIDGVWDPPIALSKASEAGGITLPGGGSGAGPTTAASPQATSAPAAPAPSVTVSSSPTAASQSNPPAQSSAPVAQSDTLPSSSAAASPPQQSATPANNSPAPADSQPASSGAANSPNPPASAASPAAASAPQSPNQQGASGNSNGAPVGTPAQSANQPGSQQGATQSAVALVDPAATPAQIPQNGASPGAQSNPNSPVNPAATPAAQQQVSIGGSAAPVENSGSQVVVAGQTLAAGGPAATVNGQQVSAGSAGGLVIGTGAAANTVPLPQQATPQAAPQQISVGSAAVAASPIGPSAVQVGSQTLQVGGPAQTVNGQVVSAGSAGIVVGTGAAANTVPLAQQATPQAAPQQVTIGSAAIPASSIGASAIQVGSQTLQVGGPAQTINGQVVSAGSAGIVVGTGAAANTVPLASAQPKQVTVPSGSFAATPIGNSAVQVGSQTLTAGGPAGTISGQVVSVGSSGLVVSASGTAATTVPFQQLAPSGSSGNSTTASSTRATTTMIPSTSRGSTASVATATRAGAVKDLVVGNAAAVAAPLGLVALLF